jgi:peptide/nickel transport system substrate-binding protein
MGTGSYWDRFAASRVSRRRLLKYAATTSAAAGAIAVVGCGDSSGTDAGGPPTVGTGGGEVLNPKNPPVHGGRVVSSNSAGIGTFDPHQGVQAASAFFPRMYNLLLSQSATKPDFVFMDLAESYEIVDELTYNFVVRPGVKVGPNDMGVPERDLDGEDVKATFDRLKTDPLTTQYSFANKYVDSASVSGATVTVKTTEPYAWFVARISSIFNTIPPRELLADPARLSAAGAGAGPYMLVSVGENENALFQRNPYYYRTDAATGERLPYVDEFEYRVVFDRAPWRTAFLSGQVHQYWPQSGEEARQLGDYPLDRSPLFAFISFTMNPERTPFQDARVRRAISRAINRQQFVDIIYGGDAQPNGLVHWPVGSYALPADELESTYQPFDLEESRSLVEAVGGITFKMMYPANTTIWEHGQHLPIFLQQMREAGIEVQEEPLDFAAWVAGYQGLNYDSSLALNQMYETPELPLLFHTTGGPFGDKSYIQGIGDPEIDAAIRKANTTLDPDERIMAVHDAQKLIYSKDPAEFPIVSPYQYTAWSPKLHNIPTGVGTTAYSLTEYWLES